MNFRNGKLWLDLEEIESITWEALDGAQWPRLPGTKAIDIERVISRHLNIEPVFADLPAGIMGQTLFSPDGKKVTMEISATLANEAQAEITGSVHRFRTTEAHEAGHALIHPCLYVADELGLFSGRPTTPPTTLCRGQDIGRYNSDNWREWQANQAMACLLLPKRDVIDELRSLPPGTSRDAMIKHLGTAFRVSQEVSRYRLEKLWPSTSALQLTLG